MSFYEFTDGLDGVLVHFICDTRIASNPKRVTHDYIRVHQRLEDLVLYILVSWLLEQIATEQQACADLVLLEILDKLIAIEGRCLFDRNRKAEP